MMNASDSPLVTVVTVCFNLFENNRAHMFEQCVASVQHQKYPRLEHLIIDGASTDATPALLEQYASRGWIRYISEPDAGIYDAMNKGIRLAEGKYIAFLNTDDFWHGKHAVACSVQELERTSAAFSYAPRTIVDEDGAFVCRESAALGVFPHLMPFCHQTMFTRRDVLLKYGGFDVAHYRSAADYDLVLRLLLGGEKACYIPSDFTSFRLGGFSVAGYELSLKECERVRIRLLGRKATRMLRCGYLDDNLWLRICSLVHPSVALDMLRCHVQDLPGRHRLAYGLIRQSPRGESPCGVCSGNRSCRIIRLFGIFPLLSCRIRPSRQDWYLFGFLPIARFRARGPIRMLYLFFVLPILSWQEKMRLA